MTPDSLDQASEKDIFKLFWPQHQMYKSPVTRQELTTFQSTEIDKAILHFKKLPQPITCSLNTYVKYWLYEENIALFVRSTLTKITPKTEPDTLDSSSIAIRRFLKLYPLSHLQKMNYDQQKAKSKFEKVVKANNQSASLLGYHDRIGTVLHQDKIPNSVYQTFLKTKVHPLPKIDNDPNCPVCQLKTFPQFSKLIELINLVGYKYPILKRFENKIVLTTSTPPHTKYLKETDLFEISYEYTSNHRHQFTTLIHELCHVVTFLELLQKGSVPFEKGRYLMEKTALTKELNVFNDLDPKLATAFLESEISTVIRAQKEINLYLHEKFPKDLSIDLNLITSPFRGLSYSIAISELIKSNSKLANNL